MRGGTTWLHRFERERLNGTPIEVRGAPMPSGGFVTTYSDVSSRREAEAKSKRSAALMRGAIDAIGEAFVLYDADDRLVFCNEKYREIYARRPTCWFRGAPSRRSSAMARSSGRDSGGAGACR